MVNKDIRPYEISLWTLQDGFITVLKPLGLGNKGQLEEPQFVLKTDGTQQLTFKIPMYYTAFPAFGGLPVKEKDPAVGSHLFRKHIRLGTRLEEFFFRSRRLAAAA